jgi:hypothetical protein
LDTRISRSKHISGGEKLAIIESLVRILRKFKSIMMSLKIQRKFEKWRCVKQSTHGGLHICYHTQNYFYFIRPHPDLKMEKCFRKCFWFFALVFRSLVDVLSKLMYAMKPKITEFCTKVPPVDFFALSLSPSSFHMKMLNVSVNLP